LAGFQVTLIGRFWVTPEGTIDPRGLSETINNLATYGWELISVNPPFHYFKRAKESTARRVQDEVYGLREA
jgi:hypothetical protein